MLKESYRDSRTIDYYVPYQPNDKDKDNSHYDCLFRALTKILNKAWIDIFEDLYKLAKENKNIPNIATVYDLYLFKKGYNVYDLPEKMTAFEFTKKYNKGTYMLENSNHVIAVQDGKYYDSYNSGDTEMNRVWMNEESKKEFCLIEYCEDKK